MNNSNIEPDDQKRLRQAAEAHIRDGTSPLTRGWIVGADALTRLYQLASDPDRGADALHVLHELQAYQVELDLQHQRHVENERELANEVARYKSLYESAPVGYMVVSLEGWIIESNRAGADLFHADLRALPGERVGRFLTLDSRQAFDGFLRELRTGCPAVSGELRIQVDGGAARVAWVSATLSPDGKTVLLAVFECGSSAQA